MGPSLLGLVDLQGEEERKISTLLTTLLHSHTQVKGHVKIQQEGVICKARREAFRENSPTGTLILDFQISEQKINPCCVSRPCVVFVVVVQAAQWRGNKENSL